MRNNINAFIAQTGFVNYFISVQIQMKNENKYEKMKKKNSLNLHTDEVIYETGLCNKCIYIVSHTIVNMSTTQDEFEFAH